MDHLAKELGMDPLELRIKNFLKDGDNLVGYITALSVHEGCQIIDLGSLGMKSTQ